MLSLRLFHLRTGKGLTHEDIANYLGITRPAYTAYESSRRQPDLESLKKLADFYQVSTDFLLGRTDDEQSSPVTMDMQSHLQANDYLLGIYKKTSELSPASLKLIKKNIEHIHKLEQELVGKKKRDDKL